MHIGVHVGVQNTTLDAAVKRLRAQGVPYLSLIHISEPTRPY